MTTEDRTAQRGDKGQDKPSEVTTGDTTAQRGDKGTGQVREVTAPVSSHSEDAQSTRTAWSPPRPPAAPPSPCPHVPCLSPGQGGGPVQALRPSRFGDGAAAAHCLLFFLWFLFIFLCVCALSPFAFVPEDGRGGRDLLNVFPTETLNHQKSCAHAQKEALWLQRRRLSAAFFLGG